MRDSPANSKGPTIGVFDSGFGGLTVLRALLPLIPGAHYIYLGDTARLPYGSKSRETIARYAVESARFLVDKGADILVIACNTATALALAEIKAAVSINVFNVIDPVVQATQIKLLRADQPEAIVLERPTVPFEVLALATAATVQSHAYRDNCAARDLHATEKACPLLVPLIEEGWTHHPVTRDVLRIYLSEALEQCNPRAVLLGCTHYPLIADEIAATLQSLGSDALVIDSAEATAQEVATILNQFNAVVFKEWSEDLPATFQCYATDSVEKFQRLGSIFLGQTIPHVELLDLGG